MKRIIFARNSLFILGSISTLLFGLNLPTFNVLDFGLAILFFMLSYALHKEVT
ncbi:MAG: hypothetical protein ACRCST_12680 [Turicibacter sp.]